jgi:chromosome segregation ATPase
MQAREALQKEREQRAAQAASVEQVRSEYVQLQRETEALGRKAAQLQGSNKGLQAKLDAQREELSGRVRSATAITMQAREDLQKEKERREAAAASNAKLQDMVERVMQDAQSAYIKAAAELKLERASRGQVEGMAADLRGQLEGIYAAKEAARSAAQHTLAILEKEESALNAMKESEASGPGTNGAAANLVAERTEA